MVQIMTPKSVRALSSLEPPPDRLLTDPEGAKLWDEELAAETEDTEDMEERLQRFAISLAEIEGSESPEVQFVVRAEQHVHDYLGLYGEWMREDPGSRNATSVKVLSLIHI